MKKRCFLACFSVVALSISLLISLYSYPKQSAEYSNPIDTEVVLISEFGLIRTSNYSQMGIGVVSFKIGDVLYGVGHYFDMQDMSQAYKVYPKFNNGTKDVVGSVSLKDMAEQEALLGEVIYNGEDGMMLSNDDFNITEYQTIKVADKVVSGEAELLIRDENRTLNSYSATIKVIVENGKERLDVCVTDQKLLEKTGGFLKGMSGSPIVQDGKLVGVLSHVYMHDHSKGKAQIIWEIDCIKEYTEKN